MTEKSPASGVHSAETFDGTDHQPTTATMTTTTATTGDAQTPAAESESRLPTTTTPAATLPAATTAIEAAVQKMSTLTELTVVSDLTIVCTNSVSVGNVLVV